MHPPFSMVFLTTLIGAGQGLFLALFTGQVFSQFKLLQAHDSQFFIIGTAISILLLCMGLFAAFFHLGRPERAWRSAARWKTSWLSREIIALPAALGAVALYGLAHFLGYTEPLMITAGGTQIDLTLLLGLLASIAVYLLFVCTGMIYAGIKFLQEWHTPLTVINYILLGTASGFTIATALAAYFATDESSLVPFYATWAIIFTVLALITRSASLIRNRFFIKPKSDMRSAIGINHENIKQISQGSMGGSFNTREYFHGKSAGFVSTMKIVFLVMVFAIPLVLLTLTLNLSGFIIPLVAVAVQYLGLMIERWVFFADANHPQNLYYQQIS